MVIKAEMAIALYCQQCGKLHINKISYFSLRSELKLLKCSCGNNLATLTQNDNKRLKLRIWCNLCQMFQEKIYLIKDFDRRRDLHVSLVCFAALPFLPLDKSGHSRRFPCRTHCPRSSFRRHPPASCRSAYAKNGACLPTPDLRTRNYVSPCQLGCSRFGRTASQ